MQKNNIKRITLAILTIVAVGAATLGISKAIFQDEELAQSTISLGTLNLQVGANDPIDVPLDFTGMDSNEERIFTMDVQNTGQLTGNFWLAGIINGSNEGENPEPETDIDPINGGELDDCARISALIEIESGQTLPIINNLLLKDVEHNFETAINTIDDAINNGPAIMTIKVNTNNCGNEAMGDVVNMGLRFYLTQGEVL